LLVHVWFCFQIIFQKCTKSISKIFKIQKSSVKMPRKRFTRRRRRYRRKKTTLKKTVRIVRQLRRATELKHYDLMKTINGVDQDVTMNGQTFQLNIIPTGTLAQGRIGRNVFMKGLHIKWTLRVTQQASAALWNSAVRIVIIKIKHIPGAVQPLPFGTFFDLADTVATTVPNFMAMKLPQTNQTYRVLYDKKVPMGALGSSNNGGAGTPVKYVQKFIRLNDLTNYSEGGSPNPNASNGIICYVMDQYNPRCNLQFLSRIWYTDS